MKDVIIRRAIESDEVSQARTALIEARARVQAARQAIGALRARANVLAATERNVNILQEREDDLFEAKTAHAKALRRALELGIDTQEL